MKVADWKQTSDMDKMNFGGNSGSILIKPQQMIKVFGDGLPTEGNKTHKEFWFYAGKSDGELRKHGVMNPKLFRYSAVVYDWRSERVLMIHNKTTSNLWLSEEFEDIHISVSSLYAIENFLEFLK